MGDFNGAFFNGRSIQSKALGAFGAGALRDGVLTGCAITTAGATISVAAGALIAGGRVFRLDSAKSLTMAQTSGYARIKIVLDLTQTSTETVFNVGSWVVEYAATSTGFAALTQNDLNMNGTTYEIMVAVVALNSGGISDIVQKIRRAMTSSHELLWSGSLSSGSLTVANFSDYKSFLFVTDEGSFEVTKIPGSTALYGGNNLSDTDGTRYGIYFRGSYSGNVVTISQFFEMQIASATVYTRYIKEIIGTVKNDELY